MTPYSSDSDSSNSDSSKSPRSNSPDGHESHTRQDRGSQEGGPQKSGPHEITSEAVKTFEFEVSAGHSPERSAVIFPEHSTRVAGRPPAELEAFQTSLSNGPPPVASPLDDARSALVDRGEPAGCSPTSRAAAAQRVPLALGHEAGKVDRHTAGVELARPVDVPRQVEVAPIEVAPKASLRSQLARRHSSWWIVSLGLHAVLLVVLACSTLVVLREPEQLELYTSPAVYETVDELMDLDIDPTDDLESLEANLAQGLDEPAEIAEAGEATLGELASEDLFDPQLVTDSTLSDSAAADLTSSLSEMGQLFGENGNGMSDIGSGTGGAMARFFGTEVKARRILYMLDNSGGMLQGGKFESLVSELQASISVLDAKQKFYVIFFSDTVYPLFYPQSVREFMPATERNRKQLQRWLESVELCTGNAIDEALAAAEVIRPDAVFLLTDGNLFTTEKKKSLLLDRAGRRFSIHTFGLGVGAQTKTAEGLRQVAEANAGTFRAIKVSAATKELAKEKQRPYHSKQPGPVWGLRVGLR